ncbi:hypothetical protein [Vulcanisaeta distributa]|uniref:hypothetical protein n=1 Tax=Vulcanisaeta distributa TaxID=164451 RepID=UPI001FB1F054|nr:hypothetical protein [Vulcanisaeta distributa]
MLVTAVPTHAMIIPWNSIMQELNLQPQVPGLTVPSQYAYRYVWVSWSGQVTTPQQCVASNWYYSELQLVMKYASTHQHQHSQARDYQHHAAHQ